MVEPQDSPKMHLPDPARQRFDDAAPFPHLVLDGVLPAVAADEILGSFPPSDWDGWKRYADDYQRGKRICSEIQIMPRPLADLLHELNSPRTLRWLEEVTGIGALIPDPYFEGGGLHCTEGNGVLAPHTDFHSYVRLGLYRRLNLIVYLNPEWKPGDGGELELFGPGSDRPAAAVEPLLGRMVVFRTDDESVHGFTSPVRQGTVRRSVATYYYTSAEANVFSGDTNTYWRSHTTGGVGHRLRLRLYRMLLFASRSMSWLAHRVNPDLGRKISPK